MNKWLLLLFVCVFALCCVEGFAQIKLDSVLVNISEKEVRISPFISNSTLIESNNFNIGPVLVGDTIYLDLCFRILTFTAYDYWDTTVVHNISTDNNQQYFLKIRIFDGDEIVPSCKELQDSFDTVVVKPTTTGTRSLSSHSIKVFPNPAKEVIKLKFPYNKSPFSVTLLNSVGVVINTKQVEYTEYELLLENLSSGLYYLKIDTPDNSVIRRIVVSK